ncbi:MAG: DUF4313 domain-containing protein [Oscillospiraceae bacterium]|nr:DUF4313 domain-containing protein [Oscillospiraceae bacterium]
MTDKQTKDTIEVNENDFTRLKVNIYGREWTLIPKLGFYVAHDFMGEDHSNLAVQLYCEGEYGPEPFATLTVNLGEYISAKFCAYVNTNNCRFAEQLLELGIAKDTGLTKQSGFCTYPLWQFNEDFLKAADEDVYKKYSDEYDKYMADEDPLLV